MNEVLFLITIILNFSGIILFYKLWKKEGLYVWIGISTIISNIEVIKCVDIFGMSLTLGNVIYGTTFLATDILSELYGDKDSRKGVYIGFLTLLVFTIMEQVNLMFEPNSIDFSNKALHTIFSITPRLCVGSLISYFVSNIVDTYLYKFIKKLLPDDKWLFVRNNGSTMTSQLIDSILFTVIAFYGIFDFNNLISLIITTYIIKLVVALCDTPFIYIAKRIKTKELIN